MSDREEQFPFQQFIGALQEEGNLKAQLKPILNAIAEHNIYWIYSSISTIVEIIKGKEEEPEIKCRSLQATRIMLETCEYPVVTLIEVYLLPVLYEIAIFRGRKSQELTSFYFQQTQGIEDSEIIRKLSLEYVQRAIELIHIGSKIKTYRTVQTQQIKQQSGFTALALGLKQKGIDQPKLFVWTNADLLKDLRKNFLDKLRRFDDQSEPWTEFLLVNLLQEIRSNKKELLELRQMLSYGQGYLTSSVINLCEDELLDISQNLQMKKKYLALLNELVRYGDIEAIIMIKNSEFVPLIVAHFNKLQGNLGLNQGENIYPQIKTSKQVKREFYTDFLRCLENWAIAMPEDYDSQEFTLKNLYKLLKDDRKFKFPENIHISRYQKQLQDNLSKNKQRNDKLIDMLQNVQDSKQTQNQSPISKVSNILQRTTLLPPAQLENRLDEARRAMKELLIEGIAQKAFKILSTFKENWITYLEALDLEAADEVKLESLIFAGQRCVQQIQLITPYYTSYSKGKITFREFKQKMKEVLDLHNETSANYSQNNKSKSINLSRSLLTSKLAKSKMAKSKMGSSKLGGKQLLDKIKAKSKFADSSQLDLSKIIDRSQMFDKSKHLDRSKGKIDSSQHQISKQQIFAENVEVKPNFTKKQSNKHEAIIIEKPIQKQESIKGIESAKWQDQDTKNHQTPIKNKQMGEKITGNIETTKKQYNSKQIIITQDAQEHIIRIDDYEVVDQKENALQSQNNRLSSSREKGSRILLRRSQNKNSRLQKSGDSRNSEDRKSIRSSKKVKESSLFIKSPRATAPNTKNNEAKDEFLKDQHQINETIEVNGNIIRSGSPTQKRTYKTRQQNSFNKFKDGVDSISSIRSNSVLRVFHNSAEKILDITQHHEPEVKSQKKKYITEVVDYINHDIEAPPIVGDYYQQPTKPEKNQSPELTPKKQSQRSYLKTEELNELHKNYFNQRQPQKPSILKEQSKIKKEKLSFKNEEKGSNPPQKNTLNKTEKPSKIQKKFDVVEVVNIKTDKIEEVQSANEKDKEIEALNRKIRELEKETMIMKTKLAAKDNQIRSIKSSSKYGSERGYPQFTTLSQSHADNSQRTSLRGSSVGKGKKIEMSRFQKDVQSQYRQYLQRIKGSTFRKSLLKLKCLVHKTDEIQIGCLSQRTEKNLQCTLYVTPHRYNLIDFTMTIIHDNCIRTKIVPEQVKLINSKKQQKIHLTIEILKIPFCLPEIEINYKADSQYSSNYNRLTLPLSFSKFCEIKPLQTEDKIEKQLHYVRSDNFKLNSKIIKLEKIIDSFPNFTILPPNKQREEMLLTANCRYLDTVFNIILNLHEKSSWIQGFLKKGDIKPMNFLICTFKQILDGSKK